MKEVIDEETHKNIAKNRALKENVFMMIVCIENRIPLFLVGKPGSSKSLSKAMIMDAMKGTAAKSDLFKRMKQVRREIYPIQLVFKCRGCQMKSGGLGQLLFV